MTTHWNGLTQHESVMIDPALTSFAFVVLFFMQTCEWFVVKRKRAEVRREQINGVTNMTTELLTDYVNGVASDVDVTHIKVFGFDNDWVTIYTPRK